MTIDEDEREGDRGLTTVRRIPVIAAAAGAGWEVYRVRTKGGVYSLAIHRPRGARPFAVLSNVRFARSADEMREGQDSAPLSGNASLFVGKYAEWIGKPLSVGMITTSPVQSVDRETDGDVIAEVTGVSQVVAPPPPKAEPPTPPKMDRAQRRKPAPAVPMYPEDRVVAAERAAWHLSFVCDRATLFADVRGDAALQARLRGALEMAAAMIRILASRSER